MYCEWDAPRARKNYVLKILAAWTAAILIAAFPVLLAINAVTL
jgi:hypothetical protein